MIKTIVPDNPKTVIQEIAGRTATVVNIKDDIVTIKVDGKKYIGDIGEFISPSDINKIREIFRAGKGAWVHRQLRRVV